MFSSATATRAIGPILDPIAARLSMKDGRFGDLTIFPSSGIGLPPNDQHGGEVKLKTRPVTRTPRLFCTGSPGHGLARIETASNFAALMAPSLGTGAFSWTANPIPSILTATLFRRTRPSLCKGGEDGAEDFMEKTGDAFQQPLTPRCNPFKLTAFLAGFRSWSSRPRQKPFGRIIPTRNKVIEDRPGNLQEDLMEDGSLPSPVPRSFFKSAYSQPERRNDKAGHRSSLLRRKDDTALPAALVRTNSLFRQDPCRFSRWNPQGNPQTLPGKIMEQPARSQRVGVQLGKRTPSLTTLRSGKPNSNARGRKVFLNEKLKLTSPASSDTPASQACQRKGSDCSALSGQSISESPSKTTV